MLAISRVLTLNKLHLLENLCGMARRDALPPSDYFHFGRPVEDPPLLRGSMLLSLRPQFLSDNLAWFDYGSPVDTGGIRFGFLKPSDPAAFLAATMCGYERFSRLMAELSTLPQYVQEQLAVHRKTSEAAPVLTKYLDASVTAFMLDNDRPDAWFFEFCLRAGYWIAAQHVEELAIPDTYLDVPIFQRLRALLGARLRTFNPRFGCLRA